MQDLNMYVSITETKKQCLFPSATVYSWTGLDALIINANKRMEETWFKVLPVILKAIDGKVCICRV